MTERPAVHRTTSEASGYTENVYKDKAEQMKKVIAYVAEKGFIPQELVANEVSWFYRNLGIDDMYFELESTSTIANHILSLYGAKIQAFTKSTDDLNINLQREGEDGALYVHTSTPGVSQPGGPMYEKRIDNLYVDKSDRNNAYRLESYRSNTPVSSSLGNQLRCYFVAKCNFVNTNPQGKDLLDIKQVSDKKFLEKATENTLEIYQRIISHAFERSGPVIELYDIENSPQKRLVIAYKQKSTRGFFSAISDLYHYYDLYSTRKYVEQFSNGITIISLYLIQLPKATATPFEISIYQVMKEVSLLFCLPTTPLQSLFQSGKLSVQEAIYGYVGWIFAQHFLNRLGSEYNQLISALDPNNAIHMEVLTKIKKRLRQDTFTREYILDIIKLYPELIKVLYTNFAMTHYIVPSQTSIQPTLSYQRLQKQIITTDEDVLDHIRKKVNNQHEFAVFESFLTFNRHILKTNFYQPTKVALSFRLDPNFIPAIEYPDKLYGMFFIIGSEFRGFHLRFKDIARGGIRIIRSRNSEAYGINLRSLFDENYALASTQQRKNKDIPEGGSKGTILLDVENQNAPFVAFQKYVDCILDLLVPGHTPGIKDKIIDKYGKPEILFFGPDEGTADYMDWAAAHASKRGSSFAKAFTTGKSQAIGGIPHDVFGMTTRSVHQYVLGIYRKLGLTEENCTKLQTGGPDGDLGSNEIKISKDRTLGIVDGSGVIYDPEGLNREELVRLAKKRAMISEFDVTKLSSMGFRVLIDESNVKLPDGTEIPSGLRFRNEFHLDMGTNAELFVPCGGRPESVDLSNVHRLLNSQGKSKFKYIVEGANLFFTQDARIRLENAGAIIFKDASANKGGVTSSSLEVLAALAFNEEEFAENMQVHGDHMPQFYIDYVKNAHEIIEQNAALEFECIWNEHKRTKKHNSILSDEISRAIVLLKEELQTTSLWENDPLRRVVLGKAFPKVLIDKLGLDNLLKRIPDNYTRAIFGSYLASRFCYKYGTEPSQFAFLEFMTPLFNEATRLQAESHH